jgi:hypothetical protein
VDERVETNNTTWLVGQSTVYTRYLEGGGGLYTLNLRITRVS